MNIRRKLTIFVTLVLIASLGTGMATAQLSLSPGVKLTQNSSLDIQPAWSPDGRKIVFVSSPSGAYVNREIYVMDANGSNPIRLTDNSVYDGDPDWAPDGTKIVFASRNEIYMMNADGSNPIRLTETVQSYAPVWSPDGTQIAFTSNTHSGGGGEIYVMNTDGSNLRNLTQNGDDYHDAHPAWSPDGAKIAFYSVSDRLRDRSNGIYVMNADGSNPTRLTGTGQVYDLTYSSDGAKIAFVTGSNIYVMNADGSNLVQLTESDDIDLFGIDWSPDGHKLVFVSARDGDKDIYVSNVGHAVNIPDSNLRAKIESALGKASDEAITTTDMATLTKLTASHADISNLTGLEHATNLTWLDLQSNRISDISALKGLINLNGLVLTDNQISDISALRDLTNLNVLLLWNNNISDISAVAGLINLKRLYLSQNSISDLSPVTGLTSLTLLDLGHNNNISDISAVTGLINLTTLGLSENSISDISPLRGLTNLTELGLSGNSISDISHLVANTGLGVDDKVDVRGNPLNAVSLNTHIPTLQGRGVEVLFDEATVLSYTSTIPVGTSLFHVPLDVEDLDTVGDLKMMLGDAVSLAIVYDSATGSWNSRNDDVVITADLGIILSMTTETTVTFTGDPWDDGTSMISLNAGSNLIGLPVNDSRVTNVSDIIELFDPGVMTALFVSTANGLASIAGAGDTNDGPVMGDAAYLVVAAIDSATPVIGTGWSNEMVGAALFALPSTGILVVEGVAYKADGATPADDVDVKVTVGSMSPQIVKTDMGGNFSVTFLDLFGAVVSTGDTVSIVVTDDAGTERGKTEFVLTNEDLGEGGAATITRDVQFDSQPPPDGISSITIKGTVTDAAGAPVSGLSITANADKSGSFTSLDSVSRSVSRSDGTYQVALLSFTGILRVGDEIQITATNSGGSVFATATHVVTAADINALKATVNLAPTPPRSVMFLNVKGIVYKADGTSPADGVTATVTVGSNPPQMATTDTAGNYSVTFFDIVNIVASTGDTVSIEVTDTEGNVTEETHTVTAADISAGEATFNITLVSATVLSYTSMIPSGISLFHVPLDVEGLDTVGDLKMMLGNAVNSAIVYDHATGSWNSRSDDVAITADLGLVLSMGSATALALEGEAWDDGASMISLQAGPNLVGLPVNDPRVTNVSDIAGLFAEDVVSTITISTDDGFKLVSDTIDAAVMGDAAYLVTASAAGTATLLGDGWTYSDMAGAAPIALAGYSVDGQTAVLDVHGAVVDEITGLAKDRFRVKVKNLSTKAALSSITSTELASGGYNMTFVDLKSGNAARVGDVLEISADSPSPLIGVKPVRHIVTVDDVKSSRIQLEELITYEIPAETELLTNYPNPFNPETWIPYRLAEDAFVTLTIYDRAGQVVRTLDVGHQIAAIYESRSKAVYWDGRNGLGEQVASGVYFYTLTTDDFSATRKLVILK